MQTVVATVFLTFTVAFANRADYHCDIIVSDISYKGMNNTKVWCPNEHYALMACVTHDVCV
jgi:hypothetical protein